jgi:type IV pilus assembly protein PilF
MRKGVFNKSLFIALSSIIVFLTACHSLPTKQDENEQKTLASINNQTAAHYNVQLGIAYLQRGDIQRAKHKLLTALEQAPNWAPAQDAMGYFLMKTGDMQSAEPYFLRAIALAPNAGSAQNNYGIFLCRNKRYQEANQHFMLAVQDKNYLNTAEAYENAGLCALESPQPQMAENYLLKAVAQDPRRSVALLELVKIYLKQQQYKQAQAYLNAYRHLNGSDAISLGLAEQIAKGMTK